VFAIVTCCPNMDGAKPFQRLLPSTITLLRELVAGNDAESAQKAVSAFIDVTDRFPLFWVPTVDKLVSMMLTIGGTAVR